MNGEIGRRGGSEDAKEKGKGEKRERKKQGCLNIRKIRMRNGEQIQRRQSNKGTTGEREGKEIDR